MREPTLPYALTLPMLLQAALTCFCLRRPKPRTHMPMCMHMQPWWRR